MSLAPCLINLRDPFSNPAALLKFCSLRIASTFLGDVIKIDADIPVYVASHTSHYLVDHQGLRLC